jgi:hypothetical protein
MPGAGPAQAGLIWVHSKEPLALKALRALPVIPDQLAQPGPKDQSVIRGLPDPKDQPVTQEQPDPRAQPERPVLREQLAHLVQLALR